ncbi:MAG: tRNA uridine-5-carboxymethylaminomethyl(34) synthesis GTPase MnmE [Chloroflexi bacterium]|nr:tRNA uridine-5-carboxymethylaminomethyl(34) synthesis GTPase MnmE [Chloroflexota bacterium]
MYGDTIAAVSTPVGEGGIGIVRLSGARALDILRRVFVSNRKPATMPAWRLIYGHVFDPDAGTTVDEVLAVSMPAPNTYTREDVAEINCHGGPIALQTILSLCLRYGARLAHPGEFTLRAFLNGRIDLAQAESVLDIVQAKTQVGLHVAMDQLGGRLSSEVKAARQEIVRALAYLTATVDFPEDEVPPEDVAGRIEAATTAVKALLDTADNGMVYRQGLRTAIVGRPNVGKSSLLNALLRQNRAIVTPVPGTTRDTLEETVNLRGLPVVLVDTAGITATEDVVEKLGVERSRHAIQKADLVLLLVDGSSPVEQQDRDIADLCDNVPAIVVVNKADLPQCIDVTAFCTAISRARWVRTSTLTGEGLAELEEAVVATVFSGQAFASDALLVSNPRHKDALHRALVQLRAARDSLAQNLPADFVCIDLTAAASALGEITGETVTEDLLETIFSQFCIGK